MSGFKIAEEILGGAPLLLLGVLETLADTFARVRTSGDVKQPLVGLGV